MQASLARDKQQHLSFLETDLEQCSQQWISYISFV